MTHFSSLIRSVATQLAIFVALTLSITGAWAAYVTLAPGAIATGQPVSAALMQQIKDNLDDLNTRIGATASVPTGAIMAYNLASCPAGWIAANGSSGTPDLRGEFIRGLDSGRGVDTGRTLATAQVDIFKSHVHNYHNTGNPADIDDTAYNNATEGIVGNTFFYNGNQTNTRRSPSVQPTGGTETRPRNVALLYCQKQ